MDPLVSGLLVLLGALIAALINERTARLTRGTQLALGEQNRETQLALARQAARRNRREQWADGMLQVLSQRYLRIAKLYQDLERGHHEAVQQELSSLRNELGQPLNYVGWFLYPGVHRSQEWQDYVEAEREFLTAVEAAVMAARRAAEGAHVWTATPLDAAHERLREAIGALHQAAERFIDAEG